MERKKRGKIDRPFLITLLLLIAIGLLMVFSASMYSSTANGQSGYDQFIKQALFAFLGLGVMYVVSLIDYRVFKNQRNAWILCGCCFVLLLLVFMPGIGVSVNGARRWIRIGVQFQPSEIAKMVGIITLAATVTNHPEAITAPLFSKEDWKWLWGGCYGVIALLCIPIVAEPSMSATLAVGLGMLSVLWFAGVPFKKFLPIIVAGLIGGAFLMTVSWRLTRLLAFFGQSKTNYQISQSLVAFGSGGLFGVGLGNGKQKLLFLPEIQNDFIFANIGEEFGLAGCLFVLLLYAFLIYRGFRIGIACKDKFGFLYTLATMTLLGFQTFINIGVATQTIPVTGMALPFISYGGTSIIILLLTIGPVLNISRSVNLSAGRVRKEKRKDESSNRRRRNRRSHISGNRDLGSA